MVRRWLRTALATLLPSFLFVNHASLSAAASQPQMSPPVPSQYQGWVSAAARGTGLSPALVAAQINMESGFQPGATSPAGAQGIAQFMPGTWRGLGIGGSPYNASDALKGYIKFMGGLVRQYGGNVRNALAAYNAGSGNLPAGYGYADSILRAAGPGGGSASSPTAAAVPGMSGSSSSSGGATFNQAGYANALRSYELGQALSMESQANPYGTPADNAIGSLGPSPLSLLYKSGAITTTLPNPAKFVSQHLQAAQAGLQQLAGSTSLVTHPGAHVNPFPGATGSRLDQGFDMTLTGKGALAPFTGKVIYASSSDPGWKGGGFIAIQNAANPSQIIYIAEGIRPLVSTGQTVRAGQQVASPVSNPYNGIVGNIEAGWAASNGRQPLAQTVANRQQASLSFYNWLKALGGPNATSTSNAGFP